MHNYILAIRLQELGFVVFNFQMTIELQEILLVMLRIHVVHDLTRLCMCSGCLSYLHIVQFVRSCQFNKSVVAISL